MARSGRAACVAPGIRRARRLPRKSHARTGLGMVPCVSVRRGYPWTGGSKSARNTSAGITNRQRISGNPSGWEAGCPCCTNLHTGRLESIVVSGGVEARLMKESRPRTIKDVE